MKIQHPLLVNAVGASGAWLIRRLVGTTQFHFRYEDPEVNPEFARRSGNRYIYAFYHEVMLFSRLLLGMARDANLDQRPPGRRADHASRDPSWVWSRSRLDHTRRRSGVAGDDPSRRSRPPLRDSRRTSRSSPPCPPGSCLSFQQDRLADRGGRNGVLSPVEGEQLGPVRRASTVRPCRVRGAQASGRSARRRSRNDRSLPRRGRASDEEGDRGSRAMGGNLGGYLILREIPDRVNLTPHVLTGAVCPRSTRPGFERTSWP